MCCTDKPGEAWPGPWSLWGRGTGPSGTFHCPRKHWLLLCGLRKRTSESHLLSECFSVASRSPFGRCHEGLFPVERLMLMLYPELGLCLAESLELWEGQQSDGRGPASPEQCSLPQTWREVPACPGFAEA